MMHKIKEMLYRELEEYANVERLSGGSLEMIHKITEAETAATATAVMAAATTIADTADTTESST